MPSRAAASTLARMADSASEDEFQRDVDALLTPDSAIENAAPAARRGGKGTTRAKTVSGTSRVTKAKAATPSSSRVNNTTVKSAPLPTTAMTTATGKGRGKKAGQAAGRQALAERPNPSDTEEVDEFEAGEGDGDVSLVTAPVKKATKRKATTKVAAPAGTKGRKTTRPKAKAEPVEEELEDDEEDSVAVIQSAATTANAAKGKRKAQRQAVEPQLEPMDIEPSVLEDNEPLPAPAAPVQSRRGGGGLMNRARSISRQRSQQPNGYRRAGSASESERTGGGDPALRRKLGDLTRKFESLDLKYRNLREVSMRDAESNFEKLKRSTDERARAQDEVIASLKREVAAAQKSIVVGSSSLQRELAVAREEIARVTEEKEKLVKEVKTVDASLQAAQSENKSLAAKLAATRNAAATATASTSATAPAAGKNAAQKTLLVGSAEAVKEAQIRQLKEDLYSDLTGLIVRGVKKNEGEDVYDCIQTGRNGTLHFHLSIASEDASGKPSATSYEDAEIAYTPLLDESRDRDLLEILPDYLTEEICFPRSSAAKFYAKVLDCMTKKFVLEE